MSKYFVTATILYLAIGTGAAFAQTQSPATQPSVTLTFDTSWTTPGTISCAFTPQTSISHVD